jgi:hypothetical protein
MRILYVDFNASFLNPTRNLLPLALMRAASTTLFGPGHVNSTILRRGLHAFVDAEGPFDVALTNSHVLFSDIHDPPLKFYYDLGFDFTDQLQLPSIATAFGTLSIPRIALFLETDYYNWDEGREIEVLHRRTDYAIGLGPEFSRLRSEMTGLKQERFGISVTDAWAGYARRQKNRIASLLHFISDPEISFRRLIGRKYAWGVVGVQYHARKVALDTLRAAGVPVVRQTRFRKLMALAKKLRLMLNEPQPIQRWFNSDYQHRLQSARYAFACGSAIDMPVRKFFEIPAAGAVLVCKPFCGFEAAGFRDGVNAIACDPKDIMDVHRSLEADPERAQAIADAGRQLVFVKHSLATRAAQMRETLSAMADGSFAGGRWSNGEYTIARKAACDSAA